MSTIFDTENATYEQLEDSLLYQTPEPIEQTASALNFA
jgi:hypothetical protein